MNKELADPLYRRDLGNGLVARWSTAADVVEIAHLVASVFRDREDAPLNTSLGGLMYELMSGSHPVMGPGDFALVEDHSRSEHRLVACTCLWRHTWEYEDIPFALGRPEIVASDPAYRRGGLVRMLFEMIHARSEAEGHLVQAITGIPYFYRLFGYEYAVNLGGFRSTLIAQISPAGEGISEACTLRDATVEDLPFVQRLYDRRRAGSLVSWKIDEAWWRYQLTHWSTAEIGEYWHIQIILDAEGQARGYLATASRRWENSLPVVDMAFAEETQVQAMVLPLLRALVAQGQTLPAREGGAESFTQIKYYLGSEHPWYELLGKELTSSSQAPYAWYVRVPDLAAFLRHIAPVLERRLARSLVAGYSGDLILDFYRGGLRLFFAQGKLVNVEEWQRSPWDSHPEVSFPPLVFLQVLFGYRSLEALRASLPDVRINEAKEVLLRALFPARNSWIPG